MVMPTHALSSDQRAATSGRVASWHASPAVAWNPALSGSGIAPA
jgi:hypothetical protein